MIEHQVYIGGRLRRSDEVDLQLLESGFAIGDGVFETLLVREGLPVDVDAHLARLFDGLARVELAIPEGSESLRRAIDAVAASAARPFARLRVTVVAGAGVSVAQAVVSARGYEPPSLSARRHGVDVVIEREVRIDPDDPLRRVKSLSWQRQALALRRARAAGAYEALLVSRRGDVVEGGRSNLVIRLAQRMITPPLSSGCLPGTVRRRLLEAGRVQEDVITEGMLGAADEIALTNSLIGVLPVSRVDGRPVEIAEMAASLAESLPDRGGVE